MKRFTPVVIIVLLACVVVLVVSKVDRTPVTAEELSAPTQSPLLPVALTDGTTEAIVTASNAVGFQLARRLYNGTDNLCISPLSVVQVLCMTYNGAAGKTQAEMAAALALRDLPLEQVNAGHLALLQQLATADPQVALTTANALWIHPGDTEIRRDFIARDQQYYAAQLFTTNITGKTGANAVNAWVAEKTRGKITDLVSAADLDPQVRLLLTNAIYFKGAWSLPFDKSATFDQRFTLADGSSKQVPTMNMETRLTYGETTDAKLVALSYGKKRLRMVIVLPQEGATVHTLLDDLSSDTWAKWTGGLRDEQVMLSMPRFTVASTAELRAPLSAMGMPSAFTSSADFSGINSAHNLFIDKVRHRALLEVNEEGAEGVAATFSGMTLGMHDDPKLKSMYIDRPFLCAIEDTATGTILFLAAVNDPGGNAAPEKKER